MQHTDLYALERRALYSKTCDCIPAVFYYWSARCAPATVVCPMPILLVLLEPNARLSWETYPDFLEKSGAQLRKVGPTIVIFHVKPERVEGAVTQETRDVMAVRALIVVKSQKTATICKQGCVSWELCGRSQALAETRWQQQLQDICNDSAMPIQQWQALLCGCNSKILSPCNQCAYQKQG